ncbi:predicted periplasmic ligand-binding sensor domain (plasmid) [Enterococcus mundtii]|uniref:Predicted periplasmic ligand-binding sensor domain n=1 Tax=Enterococcus mundtii TaxID=53346 RepID=A0AAI8WC73_ENTMU|nr:hypothetical protein [Enterococcus mundtii]BBM16251.1 predicted periplasmic ligand-binding sensor domain [Enterococcus mundtii]
MKSKLFLILPIIFICLSSILIYQSRNRRNDYRSTIESSSIPEPSAFEQLQKGKNKKIVDLGETMITFVHFEDVNQAILSIGDEEIHFPLSVTNIDKNQFELIGLADSPSNLKIGSTFGLAQDTNQQYYYYPLENE